MDTRRGGTVIFSDGKNQLENQALEDEKRPKPCDRVQQHDVPVTFLQSHRMFVLVLEFLVSRTHQQTSYPLLGSLGLHRIVHTVVCLMLWRSVCLTFGC